MPRASVTVTLPPLLPSSLAPPLSSLSSLLPCQALRPINLSLVRTTIRLPMIANATSVLSPYFADFDLRFPLSHTAS